MPSQLRQRQLPSLSHPGALLGSKFFIVNIIITAILTFGINFGIVWAIVDNAPDKRVVFSIGVFGSVVATQALLPVITYFGSCTIRKELDNGRHAPLSHKWFSSSCLLRIFFFSMGSTRYRLLMFVINGVLLLTPPVTMILLIGCWGDEGFPTSGSGYTCKLPETWQFCLIDATWKTHSAAIAYAMNFLAVHSDYEFCADEESCEVVNGVVVDANEHDRVDANEHDRLVQ